MFKLTVLIIALFCVSGLGASAINIQTLPLLLQDGAEDDSVAEAEEEVILGDFTRPEVIEIDVENLPAEIEAEAEEETNAGDFTRPELIEIGIENIPAEVEEDHEHTINCGHVPGDFTRPVDIEDILAGGSQIVAGDYIRPAVV